MLTDKFTIYVGFKDADTKTQKHDSSKYREIIINVCKGYKVLFTINEAVGSYVFDGELYVENSDVITLIGVSADIVDEIAKDICAFLNQETVLVVKEAVDIKTINDSLK